MKIYHITETKQAIEVLYYSVEAESEEKALKKVIDGSVEPNDTEVVSDPLSSSDYTVIAETEKVLE